MKNFQLSYTAEFATLLNRSKSTLAISVYQAGKILLLHTNEEGNLNLTPIAYKKPMGICTADDKMAIATVDELHIYKNSPNLARNLDSENGNYNHLYFPRTTYHTGQLDLHDLAFVNDRITAVNTHFSCISQFDENYNFNHIWKPHFVSEITPEDRCHLNGLTVINDELKYITALGSGDEPRSWKDGIIDGGILMDIPRNKIVLDGLAMPHSPRFYNGKIYLLESAIGELVEIDPVTFKKKTIIKLNGLVRGLTISDNLAFIGISKVREKSSTYKKLEDSIKANFASIHIVDIKTGMILGKLTFKNVIEEIYDVQLLENKTNIGIFGLYDDRHKNGIETPQKHFWRQPNS